MNDPVGVMMKQLNKLVDVLKDTQKQVDVLLSDKTKLLNKRLMTQNLTGKLLLQTGEIVAIITDTHYIDTYEWNAIFEEWIFKHGEYDMQGERTYSYSEDPLLSAGETILDRFNDEYVVDQPQKDERHAS